MNYLQYTPLAIVNISDIVLRILNKEANKMGL
jgi:hypothetical protein